MSFAKKNMAAQSPLYFHFQVLKNVVMQSSYIYINVSTLKFYLKILSEKFMHEVSSSILLLLSLVRKSIPIYNLWWCRPPLNSLPI
jgi:hypothetical protein